MPAADRPGCGRFWRGQWALGSDGLMQATDRGGDPNLGSILFIGQIHSLPYHDDRRISEVFEYQTNIYRLLERIGPEVIFLENEPFDLESTRVRRRGFPAGYLTGLLPKLRTSYEMGLHLFRNGLPSNLTAEDRRHFAALGAAHVYAFSHDGVAIRKSLTLEEEVEATEMLLQLPPSDSLGMDGLQRLRELYLAREVTAYMTGRGQPCNTVVVYGDAHLDGRRIEEAFKTYGFLPHIQSVIFPGALDYK